MPRESVCPLAGNAKKTGVFVGIRCEERYKGGGEKHGYSVGGEEIAFLGRTRIWL